MEQRILRALNRLGFVTGQKQGTLSSDWWVADSLAKDLAAELEKEPPCQPADKSPEAS